jgi:hypothetical protein
VEPPDVRCNVAGFYGITPGVVKSLLSGKSGAGFLGMGTPARCLARSPSSCFPAGRGRLPTAGPAPVTQFSPVTQTRRRTARVTGINGSPGT